MMTLNKYFLPFLLILFVACNSGEKNIASKVEENPKVKKKLSDKMSKKTNKDKDYIPRQASQQKSNAPSLKAKLDEKKNAFNQKASAEKKKAYEGGIQTLAESGILDQAKNVGDKAPDFILKNQKSQLSQLSTYLKEGPVVLTWYRGGWCPYCNLSLASLQEHLPAFKEAGARIVALTPEIADKSLTTKEKNNLEFEVLSDLNNVVAKQYGLVFKLPADVSTLYKQSFSLEEYNGNPSDELPLAATYVINQSGEIVYAFLDADYRNRAEPSDILAAIKNIQ